MQNVFDQEGAQCQNHHWVDTHWSGVGGGGRGLQYSARKCKLAQFTTKTPKAAVRIVGERVPTGGGGVLMSCAAVVVWP